MKYLIRLLVLSALAGSLAQGNGNTPYPVIAWGSSSTTAGYGGFLGPYTVFAGYDTYYSLQLHYAVDITCNYLTSTCTTGSGGYTPTGNEVLTLWNVGALQGAGIVSSGAMPASTQCSGATSIGGSGTAMCSIYGGESPTTICATFQVIHSRSIRGRVAPARSKRSHRTEPASSPC